MTKNNLVLNEKLDIALKTTQNTILLSCEPIVRIFILYFITTKEGDKNGV